jgi:hypothetical protein
MMGQTCFIYDMPRTHIGKSQEESGLRLTFMLQANSAQHATTQSTLPCYVTAVTVTNMLMLLLMLMLMLIHKSR